MASDQTKALSVPVQLAYGFGVSAEGVMVNVFNVFLFFYYQQIAGLKPTLCGLALFIALAIDAVTDPAIGLWSDGVRSRLGRRHLFMYASSVPLALCFLAVLSPPAGLNQSLLFLWLLVFAVATRVALTLFTVPHMALVAELSNDYVERTRLQSLRVSF